MELDISIKEKNLEEMCRSCLTKTSDVSLFVAVFDEGNTFNLWEVYENCTNIPVDENDKFPKAVCEDCLTDLVAVYHFIQKCKSSDAVLKSLESDDKPGLGLRLWNSMANETIPIEHSSDAILDTAKSNEKKPKFDCDNSHPQEISNNIDNVANHSHLNVDDNTFGSIVKSEVKSLEAESEMATKRILKQLLMTDDITSVGVDKHLLDSELLSTYNIEIKHMVPKSEYTSVERKKAWRERNKRKYQCNICLKQCPNLTRLTEHLRTHTKERPYKCDKCLAAFTLSRNLTRHLRIHTGEKPYICNVCNKGFTKSSSLNSHARLHSNEKPYLCRCGKSFHPDTFCRSSVRRYFGTDSIRKKIKRLNMCLECGSIYTSVCQSSNHTPCEDKRFLCSICGKEYVSKIGMEHHYRLHTGERPYKCELCNKCFIQPAHLKYHLLIHTGVKEYACVHCSKPFALKGNLTRHLRTHTDDIPYECFQCGKAFRTLSGLKKHEKIHDSLNW